MKRVTTFGDVRPGDLIELVTPGAPRRLLALEVLDRGWGKIQIRWLNPDTCTQLIDIAVMRSSVFNVGWRLAARAGGDE